MPLFSRWNYDGGSRSPAGYLRAIYTKPGFGYGLAAVLISGLAAMLRTHELVRFVAISAAVVVGILTVGYVIWLWGTRH